MSMRSPLRTFVLILAVTAVVLGAALVWRTELAETAARTWLARKGFPDAQLQVAGITLSGAELRDIELGPGAPAAARVLAEYTLPGLLSGQVRRVIVDGPHLTLDLGAGRQTPPLRALLEDSGREEGPLPVLPPIVVRDGAVTLKSPYGVAELGFAGEATLQDGSLHAGLRGSIAADHTTMEVTAEATGPLDDLLLRVSAKGESDLSTAPWPADWPVRPSAGHAAFSLSYDGPLPMAAGAAKDAAVGRTSTGRLTVTLEGTDLPPYADGVDASIAADLETGRGELLTRLREPATIEARRLQAQPLIDLGVEAGLARLAATARTITLAPLSDGMDVVRLVGRDGRWQARLDGRVSIDLADGQASMEGSGEAVLAESLAILHVAARTLRLEGAGVDYGPHTVRRLAFDGRGDGQPGSYELSGDLAVDLARVSVAGEALDNVDFSGAVRLAHAADGTTVALRAPGSLVLERLPETAPLRIAGPLRLDISTATARLAGGVLEAESRIDPGSIAATLGRANAPAARLTLTPGPIALRLRMAERLSARAELRGGQMALPAFGLQATGLDAALSYGEVDKPLARITLDRLSHAGEPPAFAPLAFDLTARLRDGSVRAEGQLRGRDTGVSVPIQAIFRLTEQRGRLAFGRTEVEFRPGALQPKALSGLLGLVRSADGTAAAEGVLEWDPAGLASRGWIRVDDLDLKTDRGVIEGLSGDLALARLWPPRSLPGQELTADRVILGVPLTDVRLRFRVDSDDAGAPVLQIARMEGRFSEGTVFIEDTVVRSLQKASDATLRIEGLSLASLFQDLAVEGLSGEGTLAGRIPVRFGGDGVIVDRGKLAAVSDGVLQVRFESAKQALAGQGEQFALMLRALEDFRYTVLEVTVNRPAGGDLELGIHMEGRNPAVLEGYPFRFNISLTGDLEPILLALQEGRRLSGELLQRAIEAQ